MDVKHCPLCRRKTWTGVEDTNRAALPYRLEPAALDALGELAAAHAGLRTWTMHSSGAIHLRTAHVIASRPAGSTWRQTVHADHVCERGQP